MSTLKNQLVGGLPGGLSQIEYRLIDANGDPLTGWVTVGCALKDTPGGIQAEYLAVMSQPDGVEAAYFRARAPGDPTTETLSQAISFQVIPVTGGTTGGTGGTAFPPTNNGYRKCVLGGYVFALNPTSVHNPRILSATQTTTMNGVVTTVFGMFDQDKKWVGTWDYMPFSQFRAIDTLFATKQVLSFTDEFGAVANVIVAKFEATGYTTQAALYQGVSLELWYQ